MGDSEKQTQLEQTIKTFRALPTIRARCSAVHELAKGDKLQYFSYHPEKEADVVEYCVRAMKRDYSSFDQIPAHSRWRHFDAGHARVQPLLLAKWDASGVSKEEQCARLLDLFLVSVLLDAGAGSVWKYKEKGQDGKEYGRSEGLAIASLDMFNDGVFSTEKAEPCRVDAAALKTLTPEKVGEHMQVSETNPMSGLEGRSSLLASLGHALSSNPAYFEGGRPGGMISFLKKHLTGNASPNLPITALWEVVILGLAPIWPSDTTNSGGRASLGGVSLGDVWRCESLVESERGKVEKEIEGLVPFHKLSQWLTYSLVEPLELLMGWKVSGMQDMTGLPEYRNGGLLVDFGVLALRPDALEKKYYPKVDSKIPLLPPSHPAIIEWRAMTVIELDHIAAQIRTSTGSNLSLTQILEAATWKCGREIAKELRGSNGGGPPIEIESDGTVF